MGIPEGRGDKWMVPIWVKKITVPIKISGPDQILGSNLVFFSNSLTERVRQI
jgi:hypothetical protein